MLQSTQTKIKDFLNAVYFSKYNDPFFETLLENTFNYLNIFLDTTDLYL